MSDTIVITGAVDNSLIGKSGAIQWPSIREELQAATPSADGIESVMSFTYRFMEDQPTVFADVQGSEAIMEYKPTVFTDVQGSEAIMEYKPTVFTDVQGSEAEPSGGACTSTNTVHSAVNGPSTDEGPTADDCVRSGEREVLLYAREGRCQAVDVFPEAQLMAGDSVIYLEDDEGPVVRLFQWIAGICGGSGFAVHACPEAQMMANNPVIYQNGRVQWLLRLSVAGNALPMRRPC